MFPASSSPTNAVPPWLRPSLRLTLAAAFAGFVTSFWIHIFAIADFAPSERFRGLTWGVLLVWIPTVFVAKGLAGRATRNDFWKTALKASPVWIRYTVYGFWGYAVLNLFYCRADVPSGRLLETPPIAWRLYSGHWMAFYWAAFAILYSAARHDAVSQVSVKIANED